MAVAAMKTRRQQYADVDAYCERMRQLMRDAVRDGKELSATEQTGMRDVKVPDERFKKAAPNGTYLFTIDIGPYWSDVEA